MWNPNSDNKAEDVSIAETTSDQQQALNIVDNKSIASHQLRSNSSNIAGNGKPTSITGESNSSRYSGSGAGGGNVDCTADSSSINCGEGVDSGFLSGPQLSEEFEDHLYSQEGVGREARKTPLIQLNIVQKEPIVEDYQDSGCIDEDPVDDDHHYQSVKHKQQLKKKPLITTTAATPQTQQRTIIETTVARNKTDDEDDDDQMLLDSGVDASFAEWFCKLSVNDPDQQVNNLGAASQRQPLNANSNNQDAIATYGWEVYYQQNVDGDTQLHLACSMGRVDVVAALIRMAPDRSLFNIPNDDAYTCLHLAVIFGQPKILRMLLIAGAEPISRDRNGNTPLHLACMFGDIQCVKALVIPISKSEINEAHRSYGHFSSDRTTSYLDYAHLPADLEIRNYDGERCVHLAAQNGHIEILKHLVWFGADINAREGKSGRTPLHIAIECCNETLINFLLEECSTLNLETATYAGLTAYQVACILNNSTIQSNLEQRGAEPLTPPDSDYENSDIETDLDDSQVSLPVN